MSEDKNSGNQIFGEDLEKEGRLDEAKELYWGIINKQLSVNKGCGSMPFRRLRVIYAKEQDWENAAKVCELYATLGRKLGGGNYEMKKRKMEEWAQKYRSYLRSDIKTPSETDVINNLVSKRGIQKKCIIINDIKQKVDISYETDNIFPIGPPNITRDDVREVPNFKTFDYGNGNEITHDILNYYDYWVENWDKRAPLDLKGNDGYIFKYIKHLKDEIIYSNKKILNQTQYELKLLRHVFGNEEFPRFPSLLPLYLSWDIFYTYLIPKQDINGIEYIESCYDELFKVNSPARIDLLNLILSVKYKNKLSINGVELYELSKRQILNRNISKLVSQEIIIRYLDERIYSFEAKNNINLLSLITQECIPDTSHPFTSNKVSWKIYNYKSIGSFSIVIKEWIKDAENSARDQDGLPRIGEGWVSETHLYNIICSYFRDAGYKVIHHARPPFLMRQELDIYIPVIKLGIEYQGIQHYQPIMLFGGEDGLTNRKKLDDRKRELCKKNGIKLIEFVYDEPLEKSYVAERLRKEGY